MEPLSTALFVAKLLSSISSDDSDERARAAYGHLKDKYGLPDPCTNASPSVNWLPHYSATLYYDWEAWTRQALSLIREVASTTVVNDESRAKCGDVALFFLAMESAPSSINSNELPDSGIGFKNSETWLSLVEMARGRGEAFALKLIGEELLGYLRKHSLPLSE